MRFHHVYMSEDILSGNHRLLPLNHKSSFLDLLPIRPLPLVITSTLNHLLCTPCISSAATRGPATAIPCSSSNASAIKRAAYICFKLDCIFVPLIVAPFEVSGSVTFLDFGRVKVGKLPGPDLDEKFYSLTLL